MNENKKQHLVFIQEIINRLNTNSFQIKALTITLVSSLFAIYASNSNILFIFIALFPTIILWFLDSYYLQQERKFRGIYNDIISNNRKNYINEFEMPLKKYKKGKYNYFKVLTSHTLIWFYLSIIILIITIGIIISRTK